LTPATLLILLSDGRANVALGGADPWRDALDTAAQLRIKAVVIDTETSEHPMRRASELALALRAPSILLAAFQDYDVFDINQSLSK
jgi:magnesium chelatase subunit D